MGKSTLIYEWSKDKQSLYFFAARLPDHVLLGEFSQLVAQALGDTERSFTDWSSAFLALADLARDDKFIIVIDEYTYLTYECGIHQPYILLIIFTSNPTPCEPPHPYPARRRPH
ncbi:MAG: hypothetical protein AAF485_01370 [Chloroflexota bacterium]